MALLLWAYPLLFLTQNVFGSNKGSIDNEYEYEMYLFLQLYIIQRLFKAQEKSKKEKYFNTYYGRN